MDFIYIRGFTNESDFNETRFPYFFFIKNTKTTILNFSFHFKILGKNIEMMKIFESSGLLRFLGISGLALLICPIYLFLALCVLKGLYCLKNYAWIKTPPFSTHFHWLLSYFVRIFLHFFSFFFFFNLLFVLLCK